MKNMIVAFRYANALYEEAKSSGIIDEVIQDLRQLNDLVGQNKDFATLVNSAALTTADKLNAVKAIGQSGKINRLTYAFLVVLARNKRLGLLSEVVLAINKLISEDRGELEVSVSYAVPVEDSVRTALTKQLTAITKKKVLLKESIDPSLLGGMCILVGSTLYDISVKGRLEALKNQFMK